MKRLISFILCFMLLLTLPACNQSPSAEKILSEYMSFFDMEGIIYSPNKMEGEDGFVSKGLTERIFIYEGEFPENYAISLNARSNYGVECGIFICKDGKELQRTLEMCLERVELLTGRADGGLVFRSGNILFYSTQSDKAASEKAIRKIIKLYS